MGHCPSKQTIKLGKIVAFSSSGEKTLTKPEKDLSSDISLTANPFILRKDHLKALVCLCFGWSHKPYINHTG